MSEQKESISSKKIQELIVGHLRDGKTHTIQDIMDYVSTFAKDEPNIRPRISSSLHTLKAESKINLVRRGAYKEDYNSKMQDYSYEEQVKVLISSFKSLQERDTSDCTIAEIMIRNKASEFIEVLSNIMSEIQSLEKKAANKVREVVDQVEESVEETGMEMNEEDEIQQSGMQMGM